MIQLAQSATTPTGAWIAIAAGVFGLFLGLIKLLDRLYLEPRNKINFDHLEKAIEVLTDSQAKLLTAVTAMTQESEHRREIEAMRHREVMKSLELIERKLELNHVQRSQQ